MTARQQRRQEERKARKAALKSQKPAQSGSHTQPIWESTIPEMQPEIIEVPLATPEPRYQSAA